MTRARRIGLALMPGAESAWGSRFRERAVACRECGRERAWTNDSLCSECRDDQLDLEDAWFRAREAQLAEPQWRDA